MPLGFQSSGRGGEIGGRAALRRPITSERFSTPNFTPLPNSGIPTASPPPGSATPRCSSIFNGVTSLLIRLLVNHAGADVLVRHHRPQAPRGSRAHGRDSCPA